MGGGAINIRHIHISCPRPVLSTDCSLASGVPEITHPLSKATVKDFARAPEQQLRLAGRQCSAKEKALTVCTLVVLQKPELRKSLDAFSDDFQLERLGHRQDGGRDRTGVRIFSQIADEGPIDFESVDSQVMQSLKI